MTEPFNPLAMENLAHSIVTRMMETDPTPLDDVSRFVGAGVYAIYYNGPFPAYEALALANEVELIEPIYVGKAIPGGGRRGIDPLSHTTTTALSARIREHAKSVRQASNLDIADFAARWLVIEDIWIALGESALIRKHQPVWNAVVDGFGLHDPGAGRTGTQRSRWDTMHPGRPFADKYRNRAETPVHIQQEVQEHLRSRLS